MCIIAAGVASARAGACGRTVEGMWHWPSLNCRGRMTASCGFNLMARKNDALPRSVWGSSQLVEGGCSKRLQPQDSKAVIIDEPASAAKKTANGLRDDSGAPDVSAGGAAAVVGG